MDVRNWAYGGLEGPPQWTGRCQSGKRQSPVDLAPEDPGEVLGEAPVAHAFARGGATVRDGGRGTLVVDLDAGSYSVAAASGQAFDLRGVEFHVASEHTVGGTSHPVEAQLRHRASDGTVLHVSVLFQVGESPNPFLQQALENASLRAGGDDGLSRKLLAPPSFPTADAGVRVAGMDPSDLIPASPAVATYEGSLTAPPCTEGVRWAVYLSPLSVTAEQVVLLQEWVGRSAGVIDGTAMNYRPVQPLEGRTVGVYAP